MEQRLEFFTAIYKYAPIGLVILDDDAAIIDANDYMFRLFQVDQDQYRGKQFGNVFNCSNVVDSDKVCGEAAACSFCKLRASLVEELTNREPIQDLELMNAHKIGGIDKPLWLKLSASTVYDNENRYAVVSFTDITKEKQYEEMLQYELTLDGATGTINKKSLVQILRELPGFSHAYEAISVGIIDMDDFKQINDVYGHLTGDKVLEKFSGIARESMRRQDIIGRFGGEEFMFVFPGVDLEGAAQIIRRIHNALRDAFKGTVEGIGFSAGFIQLDRETLQNTSEEEVIQTVDDLMYRAKAAGKRIFATPKWMTSLLPEEREEE